jgi:hypothetical protein
MWVRKGFDAGEPDDIDSFDLNQPPEMGSPWGSSALQILSAFLTLLLC